MKSADTFSRRQFMTTCALLLILWLAAGLRFYQLDAQSFWNDEGNSARLSQRPVSLIIEGTASDVHPPLYYLMVHGWRELVGDSEFGLRSLSAFAGVLTVAATIVLGKAVFSPHFSTISNRKLPAIEQWLLLPALLVTISPALIYYSQEARMYSLLGLEATLGSLLLWRCMGTGTRSGPRLTYFAGYSLIIGAGLYTHYAFPALILAHSLLVLVRWQAHPPFRSARHHSSILTHYSWFISWLLSLLVAFLLYLPWLPIFLRQTGGGGNRGSLLLFLQAAGQWLVVGSTLPEQTAVFPLIATLLLVILGLTYRKSMSWTIKLQLGILAVVPIFFLYGAGATQPQFYKFMTMAVPPFLILASLTVYRIGVSKPASNIPQKWTNFLTPIFIMLALFILVSSSLQSLANLYTNPIYARADYRGIVERIAADGHPNAGIILDAPNQWEVFTYYFPEVDRVYPLPRSLSQPTAAAIATDLQPIVARHDRLYAVFWGEAQRDPERLVERWLDQQAFKATEEWIGDVRLVIYAVPDAAATEMVTAVSLPFGEAITLQGYTLGKNRLQSGAILQLTLFWETAVSLETRYKVFLHLIDENGQLIAQRDAEPGGNLIPSTIWQPGETIVDNHGILIPVDTPPGEYQLLLGLYDLTNPSLRLPIQMETGIVDAWSMAKITVVR